MAQETVGFGVRKEELTSIVDKYKERHLDEDLMSIVEMGGPQGLLNALKSNQDTGLSSSESSNERIQAFDTNHRPERESISFLHLCLVALKDFTMTILLILGTVALLVGIFVSDNPQHDWIDGFAIIVAVIIVVLVTATNDYQKELKFRQLQESYKNSQQVMVLRDGALQIMNPEMLLVGDILQVSSGLIAPVDGILLESNLVLMDESSMTGENDMIAKADFQECLKVQQLYNEKSQAEKDAIPKSNLHHAIPSPVILSGTTVQNGSGLLLVVAVGANSAEGRLIELSTQEEQSTPLQKKLNKIAFQISKIGLLFAGTTVLILYLRFIIELSLGNFEFDSGKHVMEFIDYILIGIAVLAVAIPEGLPLAVAISLAYSVKKMQNENNLVKRMHASETMGGADMICSDKTGTLTTNNMTVDCIMINKTIFDINQSDITQNISADIKYFLNEAICVNSSASITSKGESGSKTELAMLKLLQTLGNEDFEKTRKEYFSKFHKIFPFDSSRKKSSTVVTLDSSDQQRVHVKGASEIIFDLCTSILPETGGNPIQLNEADRRSYLDIINRMNGNGLRTICLAYWDVQQGFNVEEMDASGNPAIEAVHLTCIAIVGIKDPVRKEVPNAVQACKTAHIKVRMVTGDNEVTAKAIAKECGILIEDSDDRVIRGKDFSDYVGGVVCKNCGTAQCPCTRNAKDVKDDIKLREDVVGNIDKFREIVQRIDVMARSKPEDKYTLVTGLCQLGHVVAVTGDGTNDAPALRKADIGFAMGIQGTMLARETADIILLDDNFASIVVAVKWGRNIYDNIRRFIQFQLTVNVTAVTVAIIGAITIRQSPLTAVQLVWVNLIMDSLASLALATEEPRDNLLLRTPQKRNESIVSKIMWKHIMGQAFIQVVITLVILYLGEHFLPETKDDYDDIEVKTNGDYVASGRSFHFNGDEDYEEYYDDSDYGPSRHLTYLFNIFVFLQLFNEFNCRRIHDELNIFQGLWGNWIYIIIWLLTAVLQVIMVQFGSYAFSCHLKGLEVEQWFISFAISAIPLVWRPILLLWKIKPTHNQRVTMDTEETNEMLAVRTSPADKNTSRQFINYQTLLQQHKFEQS